jgi:hypothetical protein
LVFSANFAHACESPTKSIRLEAPVAACICAQAVLSNRAKHGFGTSQSPVSRRVWRSVGSYTTAALDERQQGMIL